MVNREMIKMLRRKADEWEKEISKGICTWCGKKVNLQKEGFQVGGNKSGRIFNWCSNKCYNEWKDRNIIKRFQRRKRERIDGGKNGE